MVLPTLKISTLRRRAAAGLLPSTVWLVAILAAGAALRAYWTIHHGVVIEDNAAEYARIADNLRHHGTYQGLFEGPELMFPPLYPLLIALASFVTRSSESATCLVSFLAGVLLIPAVFALGRLVYGNRVALGAAVLAALHPLLIDLTATGYSVSIYLPLMAWGLYWSLRGLRSRRPVHYGWAGVWFALAFLTRPEALLYPALVLPAILVSDRRGPGLLRRLGLQVAFLLVPMIVLVSPYAAYLSVQTGHLCIEGKGAMDFEIGARQNTGMDYHEAALGLGPNLSEDGPQISPNRFIATHRSHPSLGEVARYWMTAAHRNKAAVLALVFSPELGSVLGVGLIVLGLFRRPWDRNRALSEAILLGVVAGHLFVLLGLHSVFIRYLLPLVAVPLLWTTKGIDEAGRWAAATLRRTHAVARFRIAPLELAVRGALILALLSLAAWEMRWGPLEGQGPEKVALKEVGVWIGGHEPGPKRIMTLHPQIPYYAAGAFLPLPHAGEPELLRYLHVKHPNFVVMTGEDASFSPCIAKWLKTGIPDPSAKLVHGAGDRSWGDAVVYRWTG